jgi:hypothetical protein
MDKLQDPEAVETVQTTDSPAVDLPRLVLRLRSAVAHMASHQKERENGKLIIESLAEIEALTKRFTKLDKPKYSGEPMMDSVLATTNPDFRAWVDSLPPAYWARYDLSAARIGWEAASKFILENAQAMASADKSPNNVEK